MQMLLSHGCLLVKTVEGILACCCLSSQSDLCEDSRKDYMCLSTPRYFDCSSVCRICPFSV